MSIQARDTYATTYQRLRLLWVVMCLLASVISPRLRAQHQVSSYKDAALAPAPMVAVLLELSYPSVAEVLHTTTPLQRLAADQRVGSQAALQQVEREQRQVLQSLAAYHATVLYRTQRLYNGIAIRVAVDELAQLRQLPAVRRIHALPVAHRPLAQSIPFIRTPSFWQGATLPVTGTGVTIASIDGGIDYTHAMFGGPGTPAAYAYAAKNSAIIEPGVFPTTKVVGGYDFVGDSYDPSRDGAEYLPRPDPNPLDCAADGHGTHTAGIAAGLGVNADGTTYRGPYGSTTPFNTLNIGPGVAPGARLRAYRVFSCTAAASEIFLPAFEYAIDPNQDGDLSDHSDVILAEFAIVFGAPDEPTAVAAERAAQIGALVVAAAGNDGDTSFTIASPAVAASAIAVAASGHTQDVGASFTSRGPRTGDALLKPDVAAPGTNITSAAVGTGSGGIALSGTSMSTPHVAGLVALARQLRPSWTPAEIKALVMNTATHNVAADAAPNAPLLRPVRVGAGRIDLGAAAQTTMLMYAQENPGAVSVSFGTVDVTGTTTLTRYLTLANKGTQPVSSILSFQAVTQPDGVAVLVQPATLTVPAGATATATVTLQISGAALTLTRDPTLAATQHGESRHWLNEIAGYLTATPTLTTTALRVPLYAALRPVAQVTALPVFTTLGQTSTITMTLRGSSFGAGTSLAPTAPSPLLSIYELHGTSPVSTMGADQMADLAAVGVARSGPDQLLFGLATYAPWSTPNPYAVRFAIDLDTDGSGIAADGTGAEFTLLNSDEGSERSDDPTDVFVSVLVDRRSKARVIEGPLNALAADRAPGIVFNTNVLALPLRLSDVELSANQTILSYRVRTYRPNASDVQLDGTPVYRYDLARPSLAVQAPASSAPLFAATSGTSLTVTYNRAASVNTSAAGLLLLYHSNAATQRVQTVAVPAIHTRYLPLLAR